MHKFHSIAALCGDGLRPELRELFERLAIDPHSGLRIRHDGMVQAGPDPVSKASTQTEHRNTRVSYMSKEVRTKAIVGRWFTDFWGGSSRQARAAVANTMFISPRRLA
jgi:hypothetical protein